MFDYNTIVTDDVLTMNFYSSPNTSGDNKIIALDRETNAQIGELFLNGDVIETEDNAVLAQYELWKTRPERCVGKYAKLEGVPLGELICKYEELLIGAYILTHPDEKITADSQPGYVKMIDWLRSTDFYRAPASSIYHDSYVGGLLVHTLKVYNEAILLRQSRRFKTILPSSIALVTLTHDWCKINAYESYKRNVKNDKTGQWEAVDAFRKSGKEFPLGHGATSMFMASKYFDLTNEQALAIRWHQGRWNCCESEMNELQKANEMYPLVHLLQFADQLSITDYSMNLV